MKFNLAFITFLILQYAQSLAVMSVIGYVIGLGEFILQHMQKSNQIYLHIKRYLLYKQKVTDIWITFWVRSIYKYAFYVEFQ